MNWRLIAFLLFTPSLALAQNGQVVPTGSFTPGHTVRCQNSTCTVAIDGGGSTGATISGQGYLTEIGITNTGTPFCINDALISDPNGYHQFCLGANALGGGLISYNAYGGANDLGLIFNLNGVNYAFPFPGTGNVVGPTSPAPTAGDFVLWNGGTVVKDAGFGSTNVPAFTGNANPSPNWTGSYGNFDPFRFTINNFPASAEFGSGAINIPAVLTGGIDIPSNALASPTVAGFGVAGYARSASTQLGGVGLFGAGMVNADGVADWGGNVVATNSPTTAPVTNTGHTGNSIIGWEFDVNIMKSGGVAPINETAIGVFITGGSETQVGAGGSAFGILIGPMGTFASPKIPWQTGITISDGAATNGLSIGAQGVPANNVDGQVLGFNSYGPSAQILTLSMQLDHLSDFNIVDSSGDIFMSAQNHTSFHLGPTTLTLPQQSTGAGQPSSSLVFQNSTTFASIELLSDNHLIINDPGATIDLQVNGTTVASATPTDFRVGSGIVFSANGTPGLTCSGTPTSSFATIGGIVTHC